jgi:hypothetical protein
MRRAHAIFKGPIFKVQVMVGATGAGFRQQKADARALAGQDYVMTNTGGLGLPGGGQGRQRSRRPEIQHTPPSPHTADG